MQIRVQCLIDLERLDEAVALSQGRTEPLLMAFGALALASSGRLDEARVQLQGLGPTSFIGAFLRGILPLEEGDLAAADEGLAQAIAFAERGGSPLNAASFMRLRAQCLRQQGRMDEAQALAQAALLTLERLGSPWVYETWTELAVQAALRGDGPGARLAAARVLRVRPGPGQAVRRRLVQKTALLLVTAEAGETGAVEAWLSPRRASPSWPRPGICAPCWRGRWLRPPPPCGRGSRPAWTPCLIELGQPTQARALLKNRIQGLSSGHPGGCQDRATVRKTRSGCGIRMVARPSVLVSAVMPSGEPLGLAG